MSEPLPQQAAERFIPIDEVIRHATALNIPFGRPGGDPYHTLRYYTKIGLLPHMIRKLPYPGAKSTVGHYPESVIETLKQIAALKKQGLDNEAIKQELEPSPPPATPELAMTGVVPPPSVIPSSFLTLPEAIRNISQTFTDLTVFIRNMVRKPYPYQEPTRHRIFTHLLTLLLIFITLTILSLGFSDLTRARVKRWLVDGFWNHFAGQVVSVVSPKIGREMKGEILAREILNPIVDVNDAFEYVESEQTWLRPKLPLDVGNLVTQTFQVVKSGVLNTVRFLGTIFFGRGDQYYITPLADASFHSVRVEEALEADLISTDYLIISSSMAVANLNADFLDSLDSSQFLRSDVSDEYTSGTLTFAAGTTLNVNSQILNTTGDLTIADSLSQTGGGQVAFSGNVDANSGLDVAGITVLGDGGISNFAQFSATGDLAFYGSADTITSDGSLLINPSGDLYLQSTSGEIDLTSASLMDLNAGANLDIDVTGTFDMLSTGAFSIDGTGASNLSTTNGGLTLSTIASGDLLLTAAGDTIISTGAFDLNNTGVITIGTDGNEQNITFETANFDVNSTGTITIDGTDFTYTPTGTYTVDAADAILWDTDSSMTLGAQSYALTVDGGTLTLTGDGVNDIDILNAGAAIDIDSATLDILTTAGFSIDGTGASNLSTTSGDLTLSTITSGSVILDSASGTVRVIAGDTLQTDTFTDGTLSINSGSITSGLEATFATKVTTAEIENSGNITLDAINAAVDSTVYVLNSNGTWEANLNVEGDLTVGGTSTFTGHLLPSTDDTYDLGENTTPLRWRDLYLGPGTIHLGGSGDEATLSYNDTSNDLEISDTYGDIVLQPTSGNVGIGTTNPSEELDIAGDAIISGTLALGPNVAGTCNAGSAGTIYYDGTNDRFYYCNGTAWQEMGTGTLFSNTNASLADGSYLTVTHNKNTNDLLTDSWIYDQSTWKNLQADYTPAYASSEKNLAHNDYLMYAQNFEESSETNQYISNLIENGLFFDTFEDSIKMDGTTDVQLSPGLKDPGYPETLRLHSGIEQTGRVGLWGGQTYNSSNTDNEGNNYLGADDANDVYYYDRSQDSGSRVQVDLGIDPNWANGVTLITDCSGSNCGNKTNLSTTYNGSLIKAEGTYNTEDGYIDIEIVSYTTTTMTYNWDTSGSNYSGETGATATFGSADSLCDDGATCAAGEDTGIDVTFQKVDYKIGDRFRIASWFMEPATANDRGPKQEFPERSYLVAGDDYLDIIDADTNKLWMRFKEATGGNAYNLIYNGAGTNSKFTSVHALNGKIYLSSTDDTPTGVLTKIDFIEDTGYRWGTAWYSKYTSSGGTIDHRNDDIADTWVTLSTSYVIVNRAVNDVHAAVINKNAKKLQARAYLSADQLDIANATWTKVQLNAESYDVGGNFDTTNNRFVVPQTGYYQIDAAILWKSGTVVADTLYRCRIHRNGSGDDASGVVGTMTHSSHTSYLSSSASDTIYLAKDDYVELWAFHNAGVDTVDILAGSLYTYLSIYLIDETDTAYKTYVAVATDDGVSVINESDESVVDITYTGWAEMNTSNVFIANNDLYLTAANSAAPTSKAIWVYYQIQALTTDDDDVSERDYWYGGSAAVPATLGRNFQALYVTAETSTIDGTSNTIYVGTDDGLSVIQEKQGDEADGSVKYYTKDYITEEMIGDIRNMNPMNGSGELATDTTISGFDASVKANAFTTAGAGTTPNYVTGARGTGLQFDGGDYVCSGTSGTCAGDSDLQPSTESWSFGAWIYPTADGGNIIDAGSSGGGYYLIRTSSTPGCRLYVGGAWTSTLSGGSAPNNQWSHVACTYDRSNMYLYVNGVQVNSQAASGDFTANQPFVIGANSARTGGYFTGTVDEVFATAEALTAEQIAHIYEVGKRALEGSHASNDYKNELSSDGAGTGEDSTVKAVAVDWNNKYAYVGLDTASADTGWVSKIDLNSDTQVDAYTTSTDPVLLDNDVTSLSVGYDLEIVGNDGVGAKQMGITGDGDDASGSFISDTITLPQNIASATFWLTGYKDGSDGGSSFTVKASNDGGSTYDTCHLIATDSSGKLPEYEYGCDFTASNNSLKVKIDFARTDTKANIYATQYGIAWLGQTGFRIEQADANNIRLYNYSGTAQNVKLDVIAAGAPLTASPWTDAGAYLYPTGYETVRVYDAGGTNYLDISHDGTDANFNFSGTTDLNINNNVNLIVNGGSVGVGTTSPAAQLEIVGGADDRVPLLVQGYSGSQTADLFQVAQSDGATPSFVIDSGGQVGIGTTGPGAKLEIHATDVGDNIQNFEGLRIFNADDAGAASLATSAYLQLGIQNSVGAAYTRIAAVEEAVDAYPSLIFYTKAGTGTPTERMTIKSDGKVGIGTTGPGVNLDVYDSSAAVYIRAETDASGQAAGLVADSVDDHALIALARSGTNKWYIYNDGDSADELKIGTAIGSPAVTILSNGNVGIGRTPAANRLEVAGNASKDVAGDWIANSDSRIKLDIQDIENALDIINNLRPVKFRYTDEYKAEHESIEDRYYYNFIAQEFQEVFPDSVKDDGEGYLQLDAYVVRPYLVAAVQELSERVEKLEVDTEGDLATEELTTNGEQQTAKILAEEVEAETGIFQRLTVMIKAVFEELVVNHVKALALDVAGNLTALSARITNLFARNITVEEKLISPVADFGEVTSDKVQTARLEIRSEGETTGEAIIPSGETELLVTSSLVTSHSRIFVTPQVAIPVPLAVTELIPADPPSHEASEGEAPPSPEATEGLGSFTVEISQPQEFDVPFHWWMVEMVAGEK